jgi:tetratricopeptide (TPR) repeat protein
MIVIAVYYILSTYIKNLYVLLGIFVASGLVIIFFRALFIRNEADLLEVLVDPEKHFESIKRFENKDDNKYNLLYAYGLSYTGKYEEASASLEKVNYNDIASSNNLHYVYTVTKLHLLYNNKDAGQYKSVYQNAIAYNVFNKVDIPGVVFEAHSLLLDGQSAKAEELLRENIPKVRKRILIIELEYLLALAYYNQNKVEDCNAVTNFIIEKNYPVVYTTLCKELNDSINN